MRGHILIRCRCHFVISRGQTFSCYCLCGSSGEYHIQRNQQACQCCLIYTSKSAKAFLLRAVFTLLAIPAHHFVLSKIMDRKDSGEWKLSATNENMMVIGEYCFNVTVLCYYFTSIEWNISCLYIQLNHLR